MNKKRIGAVLSAVMLWLVCCPVILWAQEERGALDEVLLEADSETVLSEWDDVAETATENAALPKLLAEEDRTVVNEEFDGKLISELENWKFTNDSYSTSTVEDDGTLTFYHVQDTGSENTGTYSYSAACDFEGVLEESEGEHNQLIAQGFSGKYAIEVELKSYIHTRRSNATFALLNFGARNSREDSAATMSDALFFVRMTGAVGTDSDAGILRLCRLKGGSTEIVQNVNFNMNDLQRLRFEIDTRTGKFDFYLNDNLIKTNIAFSDGSGAAELINAMQVRGMRASSAGSYVKLSSVRVYEIERNTEDSRYIEALERLSELPELLTENPVAVTENIDLSPYSNLEWRSGNEQFCSANGEIRRWLDPVDTYLQAVTSASGSYAQSMTLAKRYLFTISAMEGAENTMVLREDYQSAIQLEDWEFHSFYPEDGDTYFVNGRGLIFSKGGGANPSVSYDLKSYYGIKLLGESVSNSERIDLVNRELKGVYDIELETEAFVSGVRPATIEVGHFDLESGRFVSIGTVRISADKAALQLQNGNSQQEIQLYGKTAETNMKIKLRVNTVENCIYPYADGTLFSSTGVPYTEEQTLGRINAIRMALDKNMPEGDSLTLKKLQVSRLLTETDAKIESLKAAADSLTMSMVTQDPARTEALKILPEIVGSAAVTWTVNSDIIDLETGTVYPSDSQQEVTLTARLSLDGYIMDKKFYLTIPPTNDPQKVLEYYAKNLTLQSITNQNPEALLYDIALPVSSGAAVISWQSSKPDVLNENGIINSQALILADTEVILTATLSDGKGNQLKKPFPVTVARRGPEQALYSATQAGKIHWDGIPAGRIPVNATVKLTIQNMSDSGTVLLLDSNGKCVAQLETDSREVKLNGVQIAQFTSGGAAEVQLFVSPAQQRLAAWNPDGSLAVDCAEISGQISDLAEIRADGTTVTDIQITTDGFGVLESALANIDYFAPFGTGRIRSNIAMVTDEFLNARAVWSSDRADVLSAGGQLTVPDEICKVAMTLTLELENFPDVRLAQTLNCVVPCSRERNFALSSVVQSDNLTAQYSSALAVDGNDETFMQVSLDKAVALIMELEDSTWVNVVNVFGRNGEGFTLSASSDGNSWHTLGSGTLQDDSNLSGIVRFAVEAPRYLRLVFDAVPGKNLELCEWETYFFENAQENAYIDVNSIELPDKITEGESIVLPQMGSQYRTPLTWTSSHPSVISETGAVTRPKNDVYVILTVKGNEESNSFRIQVKGLDGSAGGTVIGGGNGGSGTGGGGGIAALPPVESEVTENTLPIQNAGIFLDVKQNDWFFEPVEALAKKNIISGDGFGYFAPENSVTREEFVKMAVLAFDLEIPMKVVTFTDVEYDAWYAPYVAAAYQAGVINGISENVFGVGQPITRQDAAVILSRGARERIVAAGLTAEPDFADSQNIAEYAYAAVGQLQRAGIVSGNGDGGFAPQAAVSRAETAKLIYGILKEWYES